MRSVESGGRILVTGATGYIGGRLLARLEEQSRSVRCLARHPEFLRGRVGHGTEVVRGDLTRPGTLPAAMRSVSTAYYLVHSMALEDSFAEADRLAARAFAEAARSARVGRIVYMGGLGGQEDLSSHLASRQEVGRILRHSGVPTLEIRASIIIGSGSLSFEMIRALVNEDRQFAQTRWSDALSSSAPVRGMAGVRYGARLVDSRAQKVEVGAGAAFAPIRKIGGEAGWYACNWLWRLRGWLDLMAGGPGLRRGRKDPERPVVGETIDFWRVEVYEPDRLLRLYAEMRLPGRAWLQFEVERSGSGCVIRQTAEFELLGLAGLAYWYGLYPLHRLIFERMLRRVAQLATGRAAAAPRRKED